MHGRAFASHRWRTSTGEEELMFPCRRNRIIHRHRHLDMAPIRRQPWLLPLLLLYRFCFGLTKPICCSSSTVGSGRNLLQTDSPPATNVQVFFSSSAVPAFPNSPTPPPPFDPGAASPPTSPPGEGGGGCDGGGSVAKAVVGTFFATLAVSCLVLFVFCNLERKRRRKGDQNVSDGGGNKNPYGGHNTGVSYGGRRRHGNGEDEANGVIVDENGLDVVYWRKMDEGSANLCRNCKAALDYTTDITYPTESEYHDDDEDTQQHGGRHGGGRRRGRKSQATPLLPVGSLRSSDPGPPIYSSSSSFVSQPRPPLPPPPSLQVSSHQQNETFPQNLPPPTPLPRPSTAEPSPPPQPNRSDVAAPTPPPPPKSGPPPPPPPALPKRAGPPAPPPPVSKKGPPAPPPPAMATPRVPSEGGQTKRTQLPPPAKLRPLHWDKMTTANVEHSMVWDKIPMDGSFRFDDEMMITLFGAAAMSRNSKDTSTHNRTDSGGSGNLATGQASQQQQIVLLDPRKSQNIAIVLRSLAIGRQTVVDALLDGHGLAGDVLEKFCNAPRPTKDEEGLVLGFADDPSKLADAEAFLYHLLRSVPAPFDRLEAMLFRSTFDQEVGHIKESLLVLESACKVIKGSTVFPKLLAAVLKAGNRMNAGTARGNAQAFNLTSLRKLSDVKSTNGKTTLLHFLVEEVIRSEGKRCVVDKTIETTTTSSSSKDEKEREYMTLGLPVIGGLSSEFASVKKAAPIDHDALVATCRVLETRVKGLARIVNNAAVGEFQKEMRGFLESSEKELTALRQEKERVLALVTRTTEYYVVGASKDRNFKPLQLFVIVNDFLTMVDQVCVNVARNLQQQQQQQQKMKRLKQQQQQQQDQQQQQQTNIAAESSSATETISDQSILGSGMMSSPVSFPNFSTRFLRRSCSSGSDSDSDDGFAN